MNPMLFGREDAVSQFSKRTKSMPLENDTEEGMTRTDTGLTNPALPESPNDRDAGRKKVFKSVADKMSDARSGLGRIKDAVGGGLRGHAARPSINTKDELFNSDANGFGVAAPAQQSSLLSSPIIAGKQATRKSRSEEAASPKNESQPTMADMHIKWSSEDAPKTDGMTTDAARNELVLSPTSVAGSLRDEHDLKGPMLEAQRKLGIPSNLLRRHSIDAPNEEDFAYDEARWPRRMSFGMAEEAVLRWDELVDLCGVSDPNLRHDPLVELNKALYTNIQQLTGHVQPWTQAKVKAVEEMDDRLGKEQEDLNNLYQQYSEACQRIQQTSSDVVAEDKSLMTENVKEIETLVARLDYEINSLVQRVEDIEDGVRQFEGHVEDVEKRAVHLKTQLETESFLHFVVRTLTGIGTGPNITRDS